MGSKNAGANKADAANKQVQKQQDAIQAKEAKEVRSTPYGRSLGVGLGDTSKYSGALKNAIAKSNFKNSVLGKNPNLNQLADPLGRSGLPGEYGVTPGGVQDDIQGTLGAKEISDLGAMIDAGKVAGIGGFDPLKPTSFQGFSSLNEQAAANELFGFNPTKNMSFLNSAKYQFTNPEFKRDVQRLGNLAKGIGTLSPVQNVFRSMLGMGPVKMNPIDAYNIGPKFASYDRFNPYSDEELEGMTNPAIYDRLFNNVSPVETGMFSGIPNQDTYQFTGGTPPVTIQDQFKIDPSVYDPSLNIGLDEDQVGRDIMVNPGNDVIGFGVGQVDPQLAAAVNLNEMKPFGSIASDAITDPNSIVNQMYNEMGVNMDSQEMGDALTNTFPFMGYFKN